MFKGHPKGLIIASIANMGERFGFYTMMAILLLFLQSKFGMDVVEAGTIYSTFYFLIYVLALVGGFMADRYLGLSKSILSGILMMLLGYLAISMPGAGYYPVLAGLFVIALGNGMFKGNLQALVGNLYEDAKYSGMRDRAFGLFYMFINVGSIFAPYAATGVRDWWLGKQGFGYDGALPRMCHELQAGTLTDTSKMQELANAVSGSAVADLQAFAVSYLDAFNTGYHYAFAIAAGSMLISTVVFMIFKKDLKAGDVTAAEQARAAAASGVKVKEMSKEEEKKRLIALGLVFLIVIFFWMSFHQNGVTLTMFARDYTEKTVGPITSLFFNLTSVLGIFAAVMGSVLVIANKAIRNKLIGAAMIAVGAFVIYTKYQDTLVNGASTISPEIFQSFNPIFVVALSPVVMAMFAWMGSKGTEPSAPRKIGIGMIIAAFSFLVMVIGSLGLVAPKDLADGADPERVTAYLLIGTYFSLTIAELFLSPMGISFVSKVAPPRLRGLMQGGWLCATALGNQLLFVGTILWGQFEIWQVWVFFTVCCIISAVIIFSLMKRLEEVAK